MVAVGRRGIAQDRCAVDPLDAAVERLRAELRLDSFDERAAADRQRFAPLRLACGSLVRQRGGDSLVL